MATVAVLSQVIPTPPHAPGSPHLFYLAREWSKKHSLVLICQCAKAEIDPSVAALYSAIEFLPEFPQPTILGKVRHRLHRAVFFSQHHRNPKFLKDLQERLTRLLNKYDVRHLYVAQLNATELIPDSLAPHQVTVNITDDLSLIYLREAALSDSPLRRLELQMEATALGKYMQQLAKKDYALFVVGHDDQQHLATRWRVATTLAPLGVDTDYYKPDSSVPRQLRAVFTGVMNYRPNVETACYFAHTIFPLIRAQHPALEFYIVGANPNAEVRRLAELPGVHVTGTVPDIRPYIHAAAVFVSPMHSGAGIKNKILETMAMELPVVATPLGVAGIAVSDGEHCLLSEDPQDFADKIAIVLKGGDNIHRMTKAAKEFVLSNYTWPASAEHISKHWN